MTKREVQKAVERHVAPRFPELQPAGDLLIARTGPVLRGFAFERSQMDKATFRLRAFGQLLSVPATSVTFGLSKELGSFRTDGDIDEAFEAAATKAETDGRGILSRLEDCRSMLENLDSLCTATTDDRLIAEVRAHLLAYLGDVDEAIRELTNVADALNPPEVAYDEAALERIRELREALRRSDDEGRALLERWSDETARALRLEDAHT